MNYKLIITGLLSKAYKMDDGKIAELLKDGQENINEEEVLQALLANDTERIAQINQRGEGKFQDGYKKGKKESLEELERLAKEAHQIESDKTGLELINAIVEAKAKASGKAKADITEEDVKKHPAYLSLDKKYKDDMTAKEQEVQNKLDEFKKAQKQEQDLATIKGKAREILTGLEPDLPNDQTVANNQLDWFLQTVAGAKYEINEAGQIILLDGEGKVQMDAHGNVRDFSEHVKETASKYFVFKQNNGGQGAGNKGAGVAGGANNPAGYPAGITKPKTFEELQAIVNNQEIKVEDRQAVMKIWQEENSK